jgi:hypothetical protein
MAEPGREMTERDTKDKYRMGAAKKNQRTGEENARSSDVTAERRQAGQ